MQLLKLTKLKNLKVMEFITGYNTSNLSLKKYLGAKKMALWLRGLVALPTESRFSS